ncbi:helix-turn-helix transcriptional regulator [Ensifer adhaerens]|uniref:AraC family transcriptional regulator n=1 Tax=Ensifer adhaerens TaxID=106592 RepID=UPI001CC00418|nr:helix-turn-helix transcriptional regulator [Ensifer adhaerens]MBZ7924985.1 helix-turn-helix transcriptional regulator [Ensifer adhaerens]UAX95809.1 helix-turn-helix transcriptional regulator [Ensifer adhaerens]UAY04850.1 helix-turn-helix transcriptional regulator [Ensifer adhaerens]UAY10282.1 helix-turn-helix transcriptional regulator [Ensifer adhaerens]
MSVLAYLRANNDLDRIMQSAIALRAHVPVDDRDPEMHFHRKGQLVAALRGSVICEVPTGLWMVPPQCGVWIPGGTPHSMRVSGGTDLLLLCVEPDAAGLPKNCCTLSITPLLRELIVRLSSLPKYYERGQSTDRLVCVMLEELSEMSVEELYFPISNNIRIRRLADELVRNPGDRRTAKDWAAHAAMSERTLTRIVLEETGMTFGRWRQQLQIIVALQWLYSGKSVQNIAEGLGYESVSAFINMFKKTLGKSPARYLAETAR